MKKRTALFLLPALLAALCLCLAGCGNTKTSERAAADVAEAFLTEFFSFNHQQRYDILTESVKHEGSAIAAGGVEPLPEKQRQAYEEYYRPFAAVATRGCIDAMQAGRLPLKYEKRFAEQGISARIDHIRCEPCNETTYTFEVSFTPEEGAEPLQPIKGRVTVQAADGGVYVDSIVLSGRPLNQAIRSNIVQKAGAFF